VEVKELWCKAEESSEKFSRTPRESPAFGSLNSTTNPEAEKFALHWRWTKESENFNRITSDGNLQLQLNQTSMMSIINRGGSASGNRVMRTDKNRSKLIDALRFGSSSAL
jgi:hypothetical protein